MLEQDRSVCDLVNADGACSSPYQSNSKGTHLVSLSRVSTVLHSSRRHPNIIWNAYRTIATIFAEIFPPHTASPPSSLPAIVNTLKQVCCVVLPGQINHFGKVLENNQSSGWSHNDNECQGGIGWSRPITTQLLSIHPSIHLFFRISSRNERQMSYAISNKNFTQKGKKKICLKRGWKKKNLDGE